LAQFIENSQPNSEVPEKGKFDDPVEL